MSEKDLEKIFPCIASVQKDEFYISYLRGLMVEATQKLFGAPQSIKWGKALQLSADIAFYAFTTLGGLQTLGEEYTGLIQVNSSGQDTPNFMQRLCMVALRTIVPFYIEKYLSHIESSNANDTNQLALQDAIPKIREILVGIGRFHLALFYLYGVFYSMSKRFTGVHYIPYLSQSIHRETAFKLIGYASLSQSFVALIMQSVYFLKLLKNKKGNKTRKNVEMLADPGESSTQDPSLNCGLCLQKRSNSTVTVCGHLFCWHCIHSWLNTKAECPVCRTKLTPQTLIHLKAF